MGNGTDSTVTRVGRLGRLPRLKQLLEVLCLGRHLLRQLLKSGLERVQALGNSGLLLYCQLREHTNQLTSLAALTSPEVCQIARPMFSVSMLAPTCFWSLIHALRSALTAMT